MIQIPIWLMVAVSLVYGLCAIGFYYRGSVMMSFLSLDILLLLGTRCLVLSSDKNSVLGIFSFIGFEISFLLVAVIPVYMEVKKDA